MAEQPQSEQQQQQQVSSIGAGTLVSHEGAGRVSTRHRKGHRSERSSTLIDQTGQTQAAAPVMTLVQIHNTNAAASAPAPDPRAAYVHSSCSYCRNPCVDTGPSSIVNCKCLFTALHPHCADAIQTLGRAPGCPRCHDVIEMEDVYAPWSQRSCADCKCCCAPLCARLWWAVWWVVKINLLAALAFALGLWFPLGFLAKLSKYAWPGYDESGAFIQWNISYTPQTNASLWTYNFYESTSLQFANFFLADDKKWPTQFVGFWPWGGGWAPGPWWLTHAQMGWNLGGEILAMYIAAALLWSLLKPVREPLWRWLSGKRARRVVRR